jgi:hypothetical protein
VPHYGIYNENGIWLASVPKYRLMFRDHDSLYVAFGRIRIRIMKPSTNRTVRTDLRSKRNDVLR